MEFVKGCPCADCTRVADPQACDNKNCRQWQKWFLPTWDEIRQKLQKP